jgi:chromatin assembly factor 1 subunit A
MKAEKKAQKEAEKQVKLREKEQRERERRLKKEKDEMERREKQEKREAERKKKQEELQVKLDEKRKREEEKKQEKEKIETRTKLQSQQFLSFFQKKPSPKLATKDSQEVHSLLYPPLAPKPGMCVATPNRPPIMDTNVLDAALNNKEGDDSYVSNFLASCKKRRKSCPNLQMKKLKDRVLALDNSEASNDCILVGEDGMESLVSGNPQSLKFKLLQFQENHRPPYWGTWRKQSKWVSARRPFGKDKDLLDYEVDSDEEWEEEEQGESISSSEVRLRTWPSVGGTTHPSA